MPKIPELIGTEAGQAQKSLPRIAVFPSYPELLRDLPSWGCLGLSPEEASFLSPWFRNEPWRGRRSHPWLTPVSPGHSVFAQLRSAGGRSDAVGLADVFQGDRPVVMDGHRGPLLRPRCWFKDDKNLTHLPQQKPEQNRGSPDWKGPGLPWLWDTLALMVPRELCAGVSRPSAAWPESRRPGVPGSARAEEGPPGSRRARRGRARSREERPGRDAGAEAAP